MKAKSFRCDEFIDFHFSAQIQFLLVFTRLLFSIGQTRENSKTDELLQRIHRMESREAVILKEAHELREQNELLEFRIIELEEGCDKVRLKCSLLTFSTDGA